MSGGPRAEVLFGVHPVLEALRAGRRDIDRVLVAKGGTGGGIGRVLRAAREAGVPVSHLPREALARKTGRRAVHQGVAALVSACSYLGADDVCARAAAEDAGLLVLLDGVEDPRNLGAVLRTAAAAGVQGVLLGGDRSVGLTPTVAKTAAGAVEMLAIAREPKVRRRVTDLRESGFRAVALDPGADRPWTSGDYRGRIVVVAGGEGAGLRPATLGAVDDRVRIPISGEIGSLNVSVAVGILLFEIVRQRTGGAVGSEGVRKNP